MKENTLGRIILLIIGLIVSVWLSTDDEGKNKFRTLKNGLMYQIIYILFLLNAWMYVWVDVIGVFK